MKFAGTSTRTFAPASPTSSATTAQTAPRPSSSTRSSTRASPATTSRRPPPSKSDTCSDSATPGQNMFHALLAAGTYMSGVAGGLTPPYAFTYAEYVNAPATGTCANPWKNVAVGLPANASTDGYSCKGTDDKNIEGCPLVRRSVMNPLSNANPVTCLGQDDLEGLHTLYPDCGSLSFVEPICLVYSHNLGIQRVGYYIGGFMLFILMATKSMQSYVMYFREKP